VFANRENKEMVYEMGEHVKKTIEITKGGVLVFFSSYA